MMEVVIDVGPEPDDEIHVALTGNEVRLAIRDYISRGGLIPEGGRFSLMLSEDGWIEGGRWEPEHDQGASE